TDEAKPRIVDGVHRHQVYLGAGLDKIEVEVRSYANEAEVLKDAVLANSTHGLRLGNHDRLKVIEKGQALGLKELDLSTMLQIPVVQLRSLAKRYATYEEAENDVIVQKKAALKAPVRHLSGKQISAAQAREISSGAVGGNSYLLIVRQVISGLEY